MRLRSRNSDRAVSSGQEHVAKRRRRAARPNNDRAVLSNTADGRRGHCAAPTARPTREPKDALLRPKPQGGLAVGPGSVRLILTGVWRGRKCLIVVDGRVVALAAGPLTGLCELARAMVGCSCRSANLPPMAACRLRRALREALGAEATAALIETAARKYRLTLSPAEIALHSTFDAALVPSVLSHDALATLRAAYRPLTQAEERACAPLLGRSFEC